MVPFVESPAGMTGEQVHGPLRVDAQPNVDLERYAGVPTSFATEGALTDRRRRRGYRLERAPAARDRPCQPPSPKPTRAPIEFRQAGRSPACRRH